MLPAKLLTFCAGLAYLCASAYGLHHTHVDNHLSVPIHASTNYVEGHSQFKARNIPAGGSAVDEYNPDPFGIDVGIKAPNDGEKCCGHITSDASISVWPRTVNGAVVPGFVVAQDDGKGNPVAIVCTANGPDSCIWDVE